MMRRLLGPVSLLTTLLGSGCQIAQSTKFTDAPPSTINEAKRPALLNRTRTGPEPKQLPDDLNAAALPKGPTPNQNWDQFTKPPEPPLETRPGGAPSPPPPSAKDPPVETPKHPIVAAFECVLDNRPQEAQYHLKSYDARTQEFLLRALPPLSLVSKKNLTPEEIVAIDHSLKNLQLFFMKDYTDFAIPKICFCEWIKGYAVYKPLPPDREFVASLPDRPGELVQLYVELRNFDSRPTQGYFETKLASHVEIRDERNQIKWSHHFRPDDLTLVSRIRLGEYYHNFTFTLPASLPPGSYTLVVQMTDETQAGSPRTARSSIPLRVSAAKE